jgi:hypothetical protein
MYDNSNIFDLTLSVPADSCSLFNTQYTRKSCNKDPLETNTFFAFDNNLLYYNQQLLSTRHLLDYSKESPETTPRKARVVLPGKDRKSVKFQRHFFVIFFNEKEIEHRLLNNLNQISLDLFNVKYKLNSGFDEFFYLCIALQLTICINKSIALICDRFVNAGEPGAVIVFPIKIKVVEQIRPEFVAAGSLRCWGGKVNGERKEEVITNIEQGISNVKRREGRSQMTEDRGQMTNIKREIALLSLRSTLGPRP